MSTRPLRQYYDPVTATIPAEVCNLAPWLRHRRRFAGEVGALVDDEWNATTRCASWNAKDVVSHLVTVDAFWMFTLGAARAVQPPTKFLEHFDPVTGTDVQVAALRDVPNAEVLDQFTTGTEALVALVESFAPADWDSIGESPLGHLPARLLFGHAFWDSWLHERDIFEPLARLPRLETDELLAVTCFCLAFAGLQGGLVADRGATGPGLSDPIDVELRFDDLPGTAVRVEIGTGVRIDLADPATARPAGSAAALVECFTGRRPIAALDRETPPELAAHLVRASHVL